MIYLIKSHVTGNLSVLNPIVENTLRFVKDERASNYGRTSKGTYA